VTTTITQDHDVMYHTAQFSNVSLMFYFILYFDT